MSHPIIALWSHPRSMSTAFERIMRARGDVSCLHEPFMYDYYINRAKRRMPHFKAEDDHPRTYAAIRDMILARAESRPVFFKDMSYYVMPHILEDQDFLDRVTHSFLVRDPKASITSYAKLDPEFTLEEFGIEAQWRHLAALVEGGHGAPVVMCSEQLQADPARQMRRYWHAVGLSDRPEALKWSTETPPDWQQVSGWHQDVLSSRTLKPLTASRAEAIATGYEALVSASPRFRAILEHHTPYYEKLHALCSA